MRKDALRRTRFCKSLSDLLVFVALAGILSACGTRHQPKPVTGAPPTATEVQAKLWNFDLDNWEYKSVQIRGLHGFSPLQSDLFQFYKVSKDEAGKEKRDAISIQNKSQNGKMVATDEDNSKKLSLYYNLQSLLDWDEKIHATTTIQLPIVVLYKDDVLAAPGSGGDQLNYDPENNAIVFEGHNSLRLDFEYNSGILAHEHFHQIFQHLVLDRLGSEPRPGPVLPDSSSELYNKMYLRALNEGLADFWGYLYTGDPQFVGKSIPAESATRDLSVAAVPFPTSAEFLAEIKSVNDVGSLSAVYQYGNRIARWLVELQIRAGETHPRLMVRDVFAGKVLDTVRDYVKALSDLHCSGKIPPELFPQLLAKRLPPSSVTFADWDAQWTGQKPLTSCR